MHHRIRHGCVQLQQDKILNTDQLQTLPGHCKCHKVSQTLQVSQKPNNAGVTKPNSACVTKANDAGVTKAK